MTTHQPGSPMDHEYDGIKEFDNPTPGWWHSIFIVTILFAFVYFIFFQASPLGWTLYGATLAVPVLGVLALIRAVIGAPDANLFARAMAWLGSIGTLTFAGYLYAYGWIGLKIWE